MPSEAILIELVGKEIYSKWKEFAVYLGVSGNVRDAVHAQELGDPLKCFILTCSKWLKREMGTGSEPRTWKTVLQAVRKCDYPVVAERVEEVLPLIRNLETDVKFHERKLLSLFCSIMQLATL